MRVSIFRLTSRTLTIKIILFTHVHARKFLRNSRSRTLTSNIFPITHFHARTFFDHVISRTANIKNFHVYIEINIFQFCILYTYIHIFDILKTKQVMAQKVTSYTYKWSEWGSSRTGCLFSVRPILRGRLLNMQSLFGHNLINFWDIDLI